jgi:PAS domain S-box-containing protein
LFLQTNCKKLLFTSILMWGSMNSGNDKANSSSRQLRVLMVEDSDDDAELLQRHLAVSDYLVSIDRVVDAGEMHSALSKGDYDVVIADYSVPGFGAIPALKLLKQSGRDIPFIILSGTITEEIAVAAMRAGAHDYILKGNMARLLPAIEREVQEAAARHRQRETEDALRQNEERLRAMYQHAAVGIEQVAIDGRMLMVNPAFRNLLGYTEAEMLSKTCDEFTHPEDRAPEALLIASLLNGERETYALEKRYLHKNGSPLWVSVSSALVRDAAGQPLSRVTVVQDIAERKRAELLEEQLQQAQKLESLGQLAGAVAHDFNTLLNVMLGYSELLLNELPKDDPRHARAELIEAAAQSGAQLTRQLLAFSRKQTLLPQVIDLCRVVEDLQPMLRRLLSHEIEVKIQSSAEPCAVKVDPGRMQQVVLNLATNARDAMPDGGELTIEVRAVELDERYVERHASLTPGRYVMLAVSDTGSGMDSETVAHIFEPFFTTKPPGKGTGLGLATIYGIVKQSAGDVWVYSEPGVGSIFKVYLPLCGDAVEQACPARLLPQQLGGDETILLVEDSKPLRMLTRELLARAGYRVLEACDGFEAIRVSQGYEGEIHLLMTDIIMPKMRGPEVAKRIVEQRPRTAIVFLSGYTEDALLQMEHIGPIALIEKPYTADSLLRTARQLLDEVGTSHESR